MNAKEAVREKTVGDLVAEDFRTAEVFKRHGIDFCCGGQMTLETACREQGADPEKVWRELEAVKQGTVPKAEEYGKWPLPFLADYIVNTHHAYLNEIMPQLTAYTEKIAEVHGDRHPELVEIGRIFAEIAVEMASHLREEEERLFPLVKRIEELKKQGGAPQQQDAEALKEVLAKLLHDHEAIGDAVHRIRHLSRNYAVPSDGCNTYLVTYRKLEEFEEDLHKHVHLENNILFPKAIR